jgi:alpha-D-ribose 1-methylphosphonate 5-triphosphate diphosphatase
MSAPVALRADRTLVDGVERRGWWVVVREGVIEEAAAARPAGVREIELPGCDLLPGFVDLHSDCLEQRARPRPGMEFPLEGALAELDTEVAASGVTTQFICVSIQDEFTPYRTLARALETSRVLERILPRLRVDHRIHVRVELTGEDLEEAGRLAMRPEVGLVSYMVHMPGIGQYREEAQWQIAQRTAAMREHQLGRTLARRLAELDRLPEYRAEVAAIARRGCAVLAAHDDDSERAAHEAARLGAAISEFPVNREAAAAAVAKGLGVVMGAPNARRGSSQHGNLSAREALHAGLLTALASDYHPPSMLAAAYQLDRERECSWAEAVALVASGPARLAGLGDRGRIAPGLRADLAAVRSRGGPPTVLQTWSAGRPAFGGSDEGGER